MWLIFEQVSTCGVVARFWTGLVEGILLTFWYMNLMEICLDILIAPPGFGTYFGRVKTKHCSPSRLRRNVRRSLVFKSKLERSLLHCERLENYSICIDFRPPGLLTLPYFRGCLGKPHDILTTIDSPNTMQCGNLIAVIFCQECLRLHREVSIRRCQQGMNR